MQQNHQKTVNKSKCWWKHGKHKGLVGFVAEANRTKEKPKPEMFSSVQEAFGAAKKKP